MIHHYDSSPPLSVVARRIIGSNHIGSFLDCQAAAALRDVGDSRGEASGSLVGICHYGVSGLERISWLRHV